MPRWDSEHGAAGNEAAAPAAVRLANKIRKRRAVSSSGASDPAAGRRLRSRRPAVLLPRRRTSACGDMSESSWSRHCRGGGNRLTDGTRPSASARRLVDAFWQNMDGALLEGDAAVARRSLVPWSGASTEVSRRSRSKSKILEADGKGSRRNGHARWFLADMMSNGSVMEVGTCSHDNVSRYREEKTVNLQELHNSLIASKELVKVLAHIWGPGELNPSTVSLISALHSELDVARSHVRKLIKEHKSDAYELGGLKKQLAEEIESWKIKQKEKVVNALQFIVSELDTEKKSRKIAEKANKKLSIALANSEASLQSVTRELERERKSKARVEKICSELIRGIDEDKAEVEAQKRETEKAQEELQKEREMLQLADEWREQRVQMKLLEARLQFEEKNAAVNQLRDELQSYLDTKKEQEPFNDPMQLSRASENGTDAADGAPDRNDAKCSEDDTSEGSGIHSIELNVDGINKTYTWSYTPSSKGRHVSTSRHESFSDRGMDGMNSFCLEQSFRDMDDELEGDWAEGCSNGMLNLDHDEERYQAIKNLREQMLAVSGFMLSQGRENAERKYCGL